MDLMNILQGVGQFAGAMNPDYQAGVQMAQQEMQRKKYQRIMSSPMMQKALGETFGPEVAPMMIEAAGAMPPKDFGQFAGIFPKAGGGKQPTSLEGGLMRYYQTDGQEGISPELFSKSKALGRDTKTLDEMYQDYQLAYIKSGGKSEALKQILAQNPKTLEQNPWLPMLFEGMPKLSYEQFVQKMKGGAGQPQSAGQKDQYGFTLGEVRKGHKYIGNNQWQK